MLLLYPFLFLPLFPPFFLLGLFVCRLYFAFFSVLFKRCGGFLHSLRTEDHLSTVNF